MDYSVAAQLFASVLEYCMPIIVLSCIVVVIIRIVTKALKGRL